MIAEVLHFYPGLGFDGVLELDFVWFTKLYSRIPVVEARRQLAWLNVFAYPHVDQEGRQHVQEELMRRSGYERQRQEQLAADRYEAGWAMLRSFGKPAPMGAEIPTNGEKGET
jgi:hypothetical protein